MKPEMILRSDLLDLIFLNRNKAYGAYNLRKYYSSRLTKSVALMLTIVLTLSTSWFIYAKDSGKMEHLVARPDVIDITIDPLDNDPIKKIEKPKATAKPHKVAQVDYASVQIVPDEKVDKPIAKIEDLTDKIISLTDVAGDAATSNELSPPSEGTATGTEIVAPTKPIIEEVTKPLYVADVMPEFPGGKAAFLKFMLRNLGEPDLEIGQKVVVIVKFIVAADGSISDAETMQSGGRYDKEVLRVVKKMPRWKPGIQNGKSVAVYFKLPVTFQNAD